ncbi:lipoxygenase family protein [Pseudanabaena sp. PCC 6802]|uniref:lipoxygenase family protein n=1 Tax=Pseudanabaena sp. PCC 6802 TaxID=118173 RepID=UPI00034816B5|nr:lipoxygenase family protein [Pseudanabaena sp. PCC 6802]
MNAYNLDLDPTYIKYKTILTENRNEYEFDLSDRDLAPIPMLKGNLPRSENFSIDYLGRVAAPMAKLAANTLAVKLKSAWDPLDELQDYEDFFQVLEKPKVISTYQSDKAFAEQRLSGPNPLVLKRVDDLAQYFQSSDIAEIETKLGDSIDLTDNLYVADYTELLPIPSGTFDRGRTYLPRPIALFSWRSEASSDRGQLVPVAIKLDVPLKDKTILTPEDESLDWLYAKTCVQIADGNYHELMSHLCRTHFVMEPFAIATGQHLPETHHLGALLRQHFKFMLALSKFARKTLIASGGSIDRILAGELSGSLEIIRQAFRTWRFDSFSFPQAIAARGMDDAQKLPHYPYRDDGKLVWDAIWQFVSAYLGLHYHTADSISSDRALQDWAQKLHLVFSIAGGDGKGMPAQIDTLEQLVEVVTTIVFTCGPQHAAVNFPQYEYMTFAPNMPLSSYREFAGAAEFTQKDFMRFLPPSQQAAGQLSTTFLLSSFRYDRLGHYDPSFFEAFADGMQDKVKTVVTAFQQQLDVVEAEIDRRNQNRTVPYPYLKPSLIPNSISI